MDTEKELRNIISGLFKSYEESDRKNIESFITDKLKETNIYKNIEEVNTTVNQISNTIETIDEKYKALQDYKKLGKSAQSWIISEIENTANTYNLDAGKLANNIREGLNNANNNVASLIFDIQEIKNKPLDNILFEGINKGLVANNIQDFVKNNTFLDAVILGETITNQEYSETPSNLLNEYFNQEMDSVKDSDIKKLVTTGLVIAKNEGLLPSLNLSSVEELAVITDNSLTGLKIAQKIANGDINALLAVDYLVDRTVARVNTVIRKVCAKVGAEVGAVIGSVFGPAGTALGTIVGGTIGYMAGTKIGSQIARGANILAEKSKQLIKNVYQGAKNLVKSGVEFLKQLIA